MRSRIFLSLMAVALLNAVHADGQKLGHINGRELLMAMPERQAAEEQVLKKQAEVEQELKAMQKQYEDKVAEFQNNPQWTNEEKAAKYNEILSLERRLRDEAVAREDEMAKMEADLLDPIAAKVRDAITRYAQANGYTYIFDSSQGIFLYEGGEDLTPALRKELGIE